MKIANKQKGFALLTAILISVVLIVATSAMVYKVSQNSVDIIRREKLDKALNLAESALSHTMESITSTSFDQGNDYGEDSGIELVSKIYAKDFIYTNSKYVKNGFGGTLLVNLSPGSNASAIASALKSNSFFNKFDSDVNHSKNVYNLFEYDSATNTVTGIVDSSVNTLNGYFESIGLTGYDNFDQLHDLAFVSYSIEDKAGNVCGSAKSDVCGDVDISIVPLRTNINDAADNQLHDHDAIVDHVDVLKVRATAYLPDKNSPDAIKRTVEVLMNRPISLGKSKGYNFDHAILSDGTIDLGNKDTTSGPTATTIDSVQAADVHSNGDLIIGSNGKINGKATAHLTVQGLPGNSPTTKYDISCDSNASCTDPRKSTTKVTNKVDTQSGVDEVPIPQFDYSWINDTFKQTVCDPNQLVWKDCYYNGSVSATHEFQGKVYITGNIDIKGQKEMYSGGSEPVMVVTDGTIDFGGGSDQVNAQEIVYVSRAKASPAIKIHGNPSTGVNNGAVFVTTEPESDVKLSGNIGFFGAVIAAGTVSANGNSGGIKRDSDLNGLKKFLAAIPNREEYLPKIVSWREIKDE